MAIVLLPAADIRHNPNPSNTLWIWQNLCDEGNAVISSHGCVLHHTNAKVNIFAQYGVP